MPLETVPLLVLSGRVRLYFLEEAAAPPDHEWLALLSAAERERLVCMSSDARRRSFLVARGLLRTVLADHLSLPPADVPLDIDSQGRLRVTGAQVTASLSHSGGRVMAGVAEGAAALGVDLEKIREDVDYRRVTDRMLSPEDIAAIAIASDPCPVFFTRWCLFEARHKLGPHEAARRAEEFGLLDRAYAYAVCLLTKAKPSI